jgi:hypothetical protein
VDNSNLEKNASSAAQHREALGQARFFAVKNALFDKVSLHLHWGQRDVEQL